MKQSFQPRKRHVIIGNGAAAMSAVKAIRAINSRDEILILSKENCPAYSRMLLPYYLSGQILLNDLNMCDLLFYKRNKVKTIYGQEVIYLDPEKQIIIISNDNQLQYDFLLIASGSSPFIPQTLDIFRNYFSTFWTLSDAILLKKLLKPKSRVVIVGAGPISMHILKYVFHLGGKVFLIEQQGRILPQVLDERGANILYNKLKNHGVSIHLNQKIKEICDCDGRKRSYSPGEKKLRLI